MHSPTLGRALAALALLTLALALPATAQTGDASVRALHAPPPSRQGLAGSAPFLVHASGDFVLAARGGLLRVDPGGGLRWFRPDAEVFDVGTTPDGAVLGLAMSPGRRRVLRVVRYREDGSLHWQRTLRDRQYQYITPDIAGAPDGGAWVCASAEKGRVHHPLVTRLDATGAVRWSRRLRETGQCWAIAGDASGNVVWVGARQVAGQSSWVTVVEKLDVAGNVVWWRHFDAMPLVQEVTLAADGSVTLGGAFIGDGDLMPGPAVQRVVRVGYATFVTRFDASGAPLWTWAADEEQCLAAVLVRGPETLAIGEGYMTRLDASGAARERVVFGYPVFDGMRSVPLISVTGAVLDANGQVVLAHGLPEPEAIGRSDFFLYDARPYSGPRGGVLSRPGW